MRELLGVVLCGRQSSRMGSDKGLLMMGGVTWAERAQKLLAAVSQRTLYSIRPEQQRAYAVAIPGGSFAVDSDNFKDIGPLGGLLSVHDQFPESDILLLACDMVSVEAEDLQRLIQATGEVRVYRAGEFFEPLCAFYAAEALAKISALYQEKQITASLQKTLLLPELHVTSLVPADAGRLRSQNLPQVSVNT
jgi:molybdopterin-guanine dinucleotide biosynthesis protein A